MWVPISDNSAGGRSKESKERRDNGSDSSSNNSNKNNNNNSNNISHSPRTVPRELGTRLVPQLSERKANATRRMREEKRGSK